jgi:hypothetical protein
VLPPALNCQVSQQGALEIGIQAFNRLAIQRSLERTQQLQRQVSHLTASPCFLLNELLN